MSGLLALLAATVVLTGSGTAVGFGIACVAHGNGDANCVLLVLAPVLAGLPLAGALGIWGAAGQGWLGRWRAEEEEGAGAPEQVAAEGGSASVLRQAQDERARTEGAGRLRETHEERVPNEAGPHG